MTDLPSETSNQWIATEGKYVWHESKIEETPKIFLKLLPPDQYASEIEVIDPEVITPKKEALN